MKGGGAEQRTRLCVIRDGRMCLYVCMGEKVRGEKPEQGFYAGELV